MNFRYIHSPQDKKKYLDFQQAIYQDNPYYRDSLSEITKLFLDHKISYLKHAKFFPFVIEKQGAIVLRAAFIIDYKQNNTLLVAFFEAGPGRQDAVDLMLQKGKELAYAHRLTKMIIGLNGHLNYGVGFLASHFDRVPAFGFPYNPPYYAGYFQGLREVNFSTFWVEMEKFNLTRDEKLLKRIKKNGFTFRKADLRHLTKELEIYTYLNNLCFHDHLWWAERTVQEDYELFYPFRWFIKGENLIIAEKDGRPAGLMLWYPDFNQLVPRGRGMGLTTLLKYQLGIRPDTFKIAELAVHPRYRGTGLVLGFFAYLYGLVKDKYKYCEAGWVEAGNLQSRGLGSHFQELGCREYKRYQAYEVSL
ncbi:MAG: GNAT family N-acetyltransferase [Peptococcaceae bacterium]